MAMLPNPSIRLRRIRALAGSLCGLIVLAASGLGEAAPAGSQTVTITAAAGIDLTVPAAASIGPLQPGACGGTSTVVNVKSNRPYILQVRAEPAGYPAGKAKDVGGTELANAFQWSADNIVYMNITPVYVPVLPLLQLRTGSAGREHTIYYQPCIEWADAAGSYIIVVEYLGVQP